MSSTVIVQYCWGVPVIVILLFFVNIYGNWFSKSIVASEAAACIEPFNKLGSGFGFNILVSNNKNTSGLVDLISILVILFNSNPFSITSYEI